MIGKTTIFALLLAGFYLLFHELQALKRIAGVWKRTRREMDDASRQRSLADRQNLMLLQQKHSIWYTMEQNLQYSGLRARFPRLTPELWITGNIVLQAALILLMLLLRKHLMMVLAQTILFLLIQWCLIRYLRQRNLKRTERNLTKLLDFLGNYSLSAGEVTGILGQISRYMEEPVRGALETCYYEAMTTGDAGMALIGMAERIEHPKFKELARNMEISIRYCADFALLVTSSRRSMREYLRMAQERRTLLREAKISLALLAVMSMVVLWMVMKLTGGVMGG